jgi:hypothetical protein
VEVAVPNDLLLPAADNPRFASSLGIASVASARIPAIFLPFTRDISPLKVVVQRRTMALRIAAAALLAITVLAAGDAASWRIVRPAVGVRVRF